LKHRISTDATHNPDLLIGGRPVAVIAAVSEGRDVQPLFADVVHALNSTWAEWYAMVRAMRLANMANFRNVEFRTDMRDLAQLVNRRVLHPNTLKFKQTGFLEMREEMRGYLSEHQTWRLIDIPRQWNAGAHTLCSQVMKAYVDGVNDRVRQREFPLPARWNPTAEDAA